MFDPYDEVESKYRDRDLIAWLPIGGSGLDLVDEELKKIDETLDYDEEKE